jgi:hypothetical protein
MSAYTSCMTVFRNFLQFLQEMTGIVQLTPRPISNILSSVGVTYKTGFGLDDWIYRTLCIHNSGLQVRQW